jgi:superfamily I DNA/RNA helicase
VAAKALVMTHPAHWRLVRALVPEGRDDIFLVGDAHQRIYGRPLVLSRNGIRTQGRSRRLTINYRTSEQIRRWSISVMAGRQVDDLEGETEDCPGHGRSSPGRSRYGWPRPADEHVQVVGLVKAWIAEGYEPGSIGALCRVGTDVTAFASALTAAGVLAVKVESNDHGGGAGAVQVMTMHRAKGLEFRCVAIPRLGGAAFPPPGVVTGGEAQWEAALTAERSLLYVAGSRAREQLALVYSGEVSGLLG